MVSYDELEVQLGDLKCKRIQLLIDLVSCTNMFETATKKDFLEQMEYQMYAIESALGTTSVTNPGDYVVSLK